MKRVDAKPQEESKKDISDLPLRERLMAAAKPDMTLPKDMKSSVYGEQRALGRGIAASDLNLLQARFGQRQNAEDRQRAQAVDDSDSSPETIARGTRRRQGAARGILAELDEEEKMASPRANQQASSAMSSPSSSAPRVNRRRRPGADADDDEYMALDDSD